MSDLGPSGGGSVIGDAFVRIRPITSDFLKDAAPGIGRLASLLSSIGIPLPGVTRNLEKVGGQLSSIDKSAGHLTKTFNELSAVGFAGLVVGTVYAAKLAIGMEDADAKIAAVSGTTIKHATDIGNAFLHTESIFSGQQMAEAFAPVSDQLSIVAGHALSTAEAIRVMKVASDFAEVSGTSLEVGINTLAKTLQGFQLGLGQASNAASTLNNVASAMNAPIETVSQTMVSLHSRLGEAGGSMQQVATILLDLATTAGVSTSRGLLLVNTAINTLTSGSKQSVNELHSLGTGVFDASGQFIGMQRVISELHPKFEAMNAQQRQVAASALFGQGAWKQMTAAILAGNPAYDAAAKKANNLNSVQIAEKKLAETLGHQWEQLKATVINLATQYGQVVLPVIQDVVTWLNHNQDAVRDLAIVISVVLGVAVANFVRITVVAFVAGMRTMLEAVVAFATGLDIELGLTGVGAILLAVGAVIVLIATHWSTVWKAMSVATNSFVNTIIKSINGLIDALNLLQRATGTTLFGRILQKIPGFQGVGGALARGIPRIPSVNIDFGKAPSIPGLSGLFGKFPTIPKVTIPKLPPTPTPGAGPSVIPAAIGDGGAAAKKASSAAEIAARKALAAAEKAARDKLNHELFLDAQKTNAALLPLVNATHDKNLNKLNLLLNPTHIKKLEELKVELKAVHGTKLAELTDANKLALQNLVQKISADEKAANAARTKILSDDAKAGSDELANLVSLAASTSLADLNKGLKGASDVSFNQLIDKLNATHNAKLTDLVGKLVAAHTTALDQLRNEVAESLSREAMTHATGVVAVADAYETLREDISKMAGLSGDQLIAAQAIVDYDRKVYDDKVQEAALEEALAAAQEAADAAAISVAQTALNNFLAAASIAEDGLSNIAKWAQNVVNLDVPEKPSATVQTSVQIIGADLSNPNAVQNAVSVAMETHDQKLIDLLSARGVSG